MRRHCSRPDNCASRYVPIIGFRSHLPKNPGATRILPPTLLARRVQSKSANECPNEPSIPPTLCANELLHSSRLPFAASTSISLAPGSTGRHLEILRPNKTPPY